MNERIVIGISRGGAPSPVTALESDKKGEKGGEGSGGVVLDGESSAFPRGFGLSVTPANAATKERVWRVQQSKGWLETRDFRLKVSRLGSRLQVAGVDPKSLPAGHYDIEFKLSGVPFRKGEFRNVQIPEDGSLELRFEEELATRRFELNTPVGEFDPKIRSILRDSQVDGRRADRWLQPNVRNRDRRKACLLNILAKLAVAEGGDKRLVDHIERIFFAEADRIYAEVEPAFFKSVRTSFLPKDKTVHSSHKRLLLKAPISPKAYKLQSHRENVGSGALQIVGAVPKKKGGLDRVRYVDLDIDGANPAYDLGRFFLHFGELLSGQTDHFKIRKKIWPVARDYIYYDTVEA